MWYVYFLQLKNGDIYVGSTNDLKRRFSSHQLGQVLSTKRNLPVKLKSYVAVESEALCALRSWNGRALCAGTDEKIADRSSDDPHGALHEAKNAAALSATSLRAEGARGSQRGDRSQRAAVNGMTKKGERKEAEFDSRMLIVRVSRLRLGHRPGCPWRRVAARHDWKSRVYCKC